MDRKIKKTKQAIDKKMDSLLKTDKKLDRKMESCEHKLKKGKKK